MTLPELYSKCSTNDINGWMAYDMTNQEGFCETKQRELNKEQQQTEARKLPVKEQVFLYKGMRGHKVNKK